jgi:hypothetical protein
MNTMVRSDYGVGSAVIETARLLGMTLSNVALILILSSLPAGGQGNLSLAVQLSSAFFILFTMMVLPLSFLFRPGQAPFSPRDD